MCLPGLADFIFMFPNEFERYCDLTIAQAVVLRQFDVWFKLKFRFSVRSMHMDVHASFFARKEIKSEPSASKDGRAHA